MTRLIVWRHGNTDWNAGARVQGQTDVPLNDLGRRQAVDAAELLVRMRPAAIVASDLSRAADTAAALAALTGLAISTDERLRERHFGEWQGLTMAEVAAQRPEEHARWTAGADVIGGGVETLEDLGKRVSDALQDAARQAPPGGTVVVATHGAAARQGVGHLLGWGREQLRTLRALQNCHWVELTHDSARGWQMAAYNVGVLAERPVPPPV
ncbi:putative phosphoglycerate mutase [Actinoplanes campanulatus]|uniref:Phosphoglycerate mutase n=1 Tax=Actinoplanes campanulatus TaxID=113559 RepID=A0A7W5AQ32_9ACTN|nr:MULTISPECIES: histidine phosphatase family protein [Actinoplanes]MBB3100117.1 putative phosphoglycerate mutase [Actinoplanes campanulatus]GGN28299.1 phosphoglycerate mutase [Actinoplanes campanulatus]GID39071.1 phosphoglycerate mutase [Actinoplanes campanulatus]GID44492.1 phosphoglycerate mutase [Actinoplanes capillaceus]